MPTIARVRGWEESTSYSHLGATLLAGESVDLDRLLSSDAQRDIAAAFAEHVFGNLPGVVDALGGRSPHGQRSVYRAEARQPRRGKAHS